MMTKHASWDFDEYSNYKVYSKRLNCTEESIVHVRIGETCDKHARILFFLDSFTREAQALCKNSPDPCRQLFSVTKHTFYELPYNRDFNGVNKPKNVHECVFANNVSIGADNILRAHERYVMIVIPPNANAMAKLYAHEIAHTFANHVQFRPDDHHGTNAWDFPQVEQDFKQIMEYLNFKTRISPYFE